MSTDPTRYSDWPVWKRELAWASGLIAFGLIVLPPCVYWVGQFIIGEYGPDRGLWDMVLHVWSDSAHASPLAWTLILCPYILLQSLRAFRFLRRSAAVNSVKD